MDRHKTEAVSDAASVKALLAAGMTSQHRDDIKESHIFFQIKATQSFCLAIFVLWFVCVLKISHRYVLAQSFE